jgi:hypothetical protein
MSATGIFSEEGKKEILDLMDKKSFQIGPDGIFTANLATATVNYVMKNLTGH